MNYNLLKTTHHQFTCLLTFAMLAMLFSAFSYGASENNQVLEKAESEKNVEADPTFDIFEYRVEGNTVLPKGKIEEAVYPFLGEKKTIKQVEQARAALDKVYQDAGYLTVSVSIPQQEVNTKIVTLKVTEGAVERFRVTDSKYTSLNEIKTRVSEFDEGKVPHFPTAQKQLGTVNRGQDRQVTPVLRPGKSPGKVEIDLKVQDQLPLHASLELNDRYAPNTTRTRLNGSLRYDNLWQKDHSIGLSFQVSPEDTSEVRVLSATYLIPRLNGDYFAAYGVLSDSDISAVGDVNVIGKGKILGARYIHPLAPINNFYHNLTLGADYKDFDETVRLLGSDGFNTPISYLGFLLGYDGTLQGESSQTQFNINVNFAPRGLGNTEEEFSNRRLLGRPNYAYLRADIKHLQKLPGDWALQAKLGGQLANDPLIANEQYSAGGVDTVRGYAESQILGDNGIYGSIELRTPSFKKYFKDYIKDLYGFAFLDAATVRTLEPQTGQLESSDIASSGLGLKLKATMGLFAYLDYAVALKDAGKVNSGDERLHFRLGYDW